MIEVFLIAAVILLGAAVWMLAIVLQRTARSDPSLVLSRLGTLEKFQERGERTLADSLERTRQDGAEQARGLREEVQNTLQRSTDSLVASVEKLSAGQQ